MIRNMSYAIFGCRDLEGSTRFLTDFGLAVSNEQPGCIYFRGAEDRPYLFILKEAEKPGLIAAGYEVDSEKSLRAIARQLEISVEPILDNPWGGLRAVTSDCDGNGIELVYGVQRVEPLPMPRRVVLFNSNGKITRKGRLPIFDEAPTPVVRLCHVVHVSPDVHRFTDWYVKNLGAYPSDILTNTEHPEKAAAAFLRFPRGAEYVDHHNVAAFSGDEVGVQHVCFESLDLDAVFMAHRYLKAKGHRQSWGPVRHMVGGALSDYWLTPWGLRVEHVVDGDYLNDDFETQVAPLNHRVALQWTTQELPTAFKVDIGS